MYDERGLPQSKVLSSGCVSYKQTMVTVRSVHSNRQCDAFMKRMNGEVCEGEVWKMDVNHKRTDYLSWDEYFMGVAMMSGMRSKDPNSQVGACIVSEDNKILSMGYNGFPKGCSDDEFPWAREGDSLHTKYFYVTHSELNAILNYRGGSLEGAKLYVSLFPCNECAKAIIQAGIKTIVYDCDKYADTPAVIASKRMLDAAGVRYYKYNRTGRKITIEV